MSPLQLGEEIREIQATTSDDSTFGARQSSMKAPGANCFRRGSSDDFLKAQVVSQRSPFKVS